MSINKIYFVIALVLIFTTVLFSSCTDNSAGDPFVVRNDDWVKGPDNALITIIEYSDFECSACAIASPILKQTSEAFSSDVRVVFRYFPLDQHENALLAAQAAQAAGYQNKFWEMHDLLFQNVKDWSENENPLKVFEKYADQLSLNKDQFNKDYNHNSTKQRILLDKKDHNTLKLLGTPSIFVNGQLVNLAPFEEFKQTIQQAILKAKANPN